MSAVVMPGADTDAAAPPMTRHEYRTAAKVLHWLTVALVACMIATGVTATQLGEGAVADLLLALHKLTGACILVLALIRFGYRLTRSLPPPPERSRTRPLLHWTLYGIIVLVPLLGWAGASASGGREIFAGLSLPEIWPEGGGWDMLLLHWHAYAAFALLALVALHVGIAMQDYMAAPDAPSASAHRLAP
jgi:cytochrome b561